MSISTTVKIITKYNLQHKKHRHYHNLASGFAKRRVKYKQRVKRSPQVKDTGYIEIDTITTFIEGIKLNGFNGVVIKLRFLVFIWIHNIKQ